MSRPSRWGPIAIFLIAFTSSARVSAQVATPPSQNYADEPFIIESLVNNLSYENDGTFTQDIAARVRIQSSAGVQQFGLLRFPYGASTGEEEVVYVRVTRPDGTVVATPQENVQDMPAQITIQAPFYSDLKEKQTAVRGLEIGDVLEFEHRFHARTPLAPGQFWFEDNFVTDAITLHEELRISMPAGRAIALKSPRIQPTVSEVDGRRLYVWNTGNLKRKTEAEITKEQTAAEPKWPDVRLSSFQSWEEVAQWYRQLQSPRAESSPEIRAKAQELTKDATSDADRIRILYDYVGTKFRYIGIAFGIGRYQPHSAVDVLGNGFGDCKDKHTLLAALLASVGVKSFPVLVNSEGKIDSDVPSPGQFNHVITAVPQGKDLLWLDATAEVAPEGYLYESVRDKQVLLVSDAGSRLVKTPAELPFPQKFTFSTEGKIGEDGVLIAHTDIRARGDFEVVLRNAFHQTPQPQWKDIVQRVSQQLGFAGEVEDVTISPPEATNDALDVRYTYTRKNYPSWPDQIGVPVPPSNLLPLPDDDDKIPAMIPLVPSGDTQLDSKIELPKGVTPKLSAPVNLVTDFAEYHSVPVWESGVLHVQRHLVTHVRELPKARSKAYRDFWKTVNDDENSYMSLERGPASPSAESASNSGGPLSSTEQQRRADFTQFMEAGRESFLQKDFPAAAKAMQDALAIESNSAEAWALLANLHVSMGQLDQAAADPGKVLDLSPSNAATLDLAAFALSQLHRDDDAVQTWKKQMSLFPTDIIAPRALGTFLVDHQRYAEAVAVLQPVLDKGSKDGRTAFVLGRAYVRSGDSEKAADAFARAISSDSSPSMQNDVAFELADAGEGLDDALSDAQQAVNAEEDRTEAIAAAGLSVDDLRQMRILATYWDTLGWVQFRLAHLDSAEKYLTAAWELSESGLVASHLSQLYEKEGKREQAARFYALALGASDSPATDRDRLVHLAGSQDRADQTAMKALSDLPQLRHVHLPQLTKSESHGEVFLFYSREDGLRAIRFITGSDDLRAATQSLMASKANADFPDDRPVNIVRRAVIYCSSLGRGCDMVLLLPGTVTSLN